MVDDTKYQAVFPPMTWGQLGKILENLPRGVFPEIHRLIARDEDPKRKPNGATPPRGELEDAILKALKTRDLSHAEIAEKTGRNPKSVYSALTRMRKKRMVTKDREGRYASV
jgi:hypothetical protein